MGFTLAQTPLKPMTQRHPFLLHSERAPLQKRPRSLVQEMRGPASRLYMERMVGPMSYRPRLYPTLAHLQR